MREITDLAALEWFCGGRSRILGGRVLIVAAHPDDEVVGAGGNLSRFRDVRILHLTDGAPRDGSDAAVAGFPDAESYGAARRRELLEALALAGLGEDRVETLGLPDQGASADLASLSLRLLSVLLAQRPALILTHPYEGGHPDHDAAAFAVFAACALIRSSGGIPPARLEFTSYHAGLHGMVTSRFLQERGAQVIVLSPEERRLKEAMLACFVTQRRTLSWFPVGVEAFRPAPAYDFTRPPHRGRLWYEWFGWGGIDGEGWRRRAADALFDLGLRGTV